mgnify:CR=1 FL=1
MKNGFLGFHASLMLDVVVCALVLVVPALLYSLYLVKVRHHFSAHKSLQLLLGVVLLIAVTAFEVDTQFVHGGWQNIVNKPGAEPRLTGSDLEWARTVLRIHLVFAVSTPVLWIATIVLALRRFPSPPTPGPHSHLHKKLGWLATIDITMTSVTGLWWYYVAFVAKVGA